VKAPGSARPNLRLWEASGCHWCGQQIDPVKLDVREREKRRHDPRCAINKRFSHGLGLAPTPENPGDLVTDKGYHSRDGLKELNGGPWKTRIAEPKPANGYLRWHGDNAARDAVYANRARLKSGVGRDAMRRRGEMVERSFAHILDRGGMRRAWLRGRENVHKRYLIHVAGFNLGILMRALFGCGTPREAAAAKNTLLFLIQTDAALAIAMLADIDGEMAMLVIVVAPAPT
jgi:transposase